MPTAEQIEQVITAWERRAKDQMHIDGLLAPACRRDLVASLVRLLGDTAPSLPSRRGVKRGHENVD